jgi:iron complex outermembrane receptor protein
MSPDLARAAATAAIGALLLGGPLRAQQQLERVVITGSTVPRVDAETALPVQVITRQDIERSGALGVDDLMSRISANFGGSNEAVSIINGDTPGFSGASLRGLDSRSTLVLLNGRRLANHAFSGPGGVGVDLHAIPLAAIERIEILKDGASAIYGSDAIAGTINFILRRDFSGIDVGVERSGTRRGGGSRHRETLSVGAGDAASDGYNAFAVLDHDVGHALWSQQRRFASTAYRPDIGLDGTAPRTFPANIIGPEFFEFLNPAAPGCTALTVFEHGGCFFDYVRLIDLVPPTRRLGLLARATRSTGAEGEVVVELVASRQRTLNKVAPTPTDRITLASNVPLVVPESSPYYPRGLGLSGDIVNPLYRTAPLGPRTSRVESRQWRALLSWHGVVAGWDVDTAVARSLSRASNAFVSGYVDSQRLVDAFQTGLINPFGDSGPEGNALLASTQIIGRQREATGSTTLVDLRASRDIARWSAGALTLGLGLEARREALVDGTTAAAERAAGANVHSLGGGRHAEAAYAELALPLAKTLDAQLALRVDRYSDFGTASNPKVALRWLPAKPLLLRASVGRGFRAPSLPELYSAQTARVGFVSEPDPLRCPTTELDSDCGFGEASVVDGGNPQLQPERSRQYSYGLVFEPVAGVSIGIERWRIAIGDVIQPLPLDIVVARPDLFASRITRGPVDPRFPDLPGPITRLVLIEANVGRQVVAGTDVDVRWRGAATEVGRFGVRIAGSYLDRWRLSFDGVTESSGLDGRLPDARFARWRHSASVEWDRGPWNATLTQLWQSSYHDAPADEFRVGPLPARRVAPHHMWDAQLGYTGLRDLALVLGVKNLFDRNPPSTRQQDTAQLGYAPSYADPRGRTLYARADWRWR